MQIRESGLSMEASLVNAMGITCLPPQPFLIVGRIRRVHRLPRAPAASTLRFVQRLVPVKPI